MAKIKNWSKKEKNLWVNDNSKVEIFIDTWGLAHNEKFKYRIIKQKNSREKMIGTANKYKEAYNFAINWMRNHPKG